MSHREYYLDHAAATPLSERVFLAMQPYLTEHFYNPSAAYGPAREVKMALQDARHRLAIAIGAQSSEVVLTAGATESIHLAFRGVWRAGYNCVIGATEHPAVRGAAALFEIVKVANADRRGIISAAAVREQIDDDTLLVSVSLADSELGVVQPLKEIAAVIQQVREDRRRRGVDVPLLLHSDGSQALGQLDVHVARLGIDLLTLNAAKCYGPKQVGLLWIRAGLVLESYLRGGGQERGLRAGTENVAGAVGFACAAERAVRKRHEWSRTLSMMRDELQAHLTKAVPDLVVDGHPKRRLPGHLHVSLEGLDAERVVYALDARGVYIATGAACAANKGTRSATLQAIGMSDAQADGSMRLTLGALNAPDDIPQIAELIAQAITRERVL